MASLVWCLKKKQGIALVEPNENLAKEYMASAEETLSILHEIEHKSNMWLATTKYYCEYFAIYALFMRLGIKCEIHDCSIALAKLLEAEGLLPKGTTKKLEEDKQLRIDNQYYLKNQKVLIDYHGLTSLILTIKQQTFSLPLETIERIRKMIEELLN